MKIRGHIEVKDFKIIWKVKNLQNFLLDEIQMNIPKGVKLLAFPAGVKYNEKFIIEEVIIQLFYI